METGKLIKELRIKKGLTQEELADKTEVSARTIQRIENGEVDPRAYTLQMIARALEVDYSMFTDNESDESQEIKKADENNWAGLLHLSGILPLIIPTVLIWNLKKEKVKGLTGHYRAVISFQLMVLGLTLGGLWIYWKANILTPLIGIMLMSSLFSIFNAVNVMSGKPYKHIDFYTSGPKRDKTE
jgi:transcriptional regulator with XRE-family HTH domain